MSLVRRVLVRTLPFAGVALAADPAWAGTCYSVAQCAGNDVGGARLLLAAAGCVVGVIFCVAGDRAGSD